jgi:HK97 gp10 family phage protein
MAEATLKVDGLRELQDKLRNLAPNIARNGLRAAVAAGAALIRNEARQKAPKDTGEMARDIMIKRERDSTTYRALYSVFVRTGKKSRLGGKGRNVAKDSYYWRFVEFGTAKMAAKPFMRPAFESQKEKAVDAIRDKLAARIAEEASKP